MINGKHRATVTFYLSGGGTKIFKGTLKNYESAYSWAIHQSVTKQLYSHHIEPDIKIEPVQENFRKASLLTSSIA